MLFAELTEKHREEFHRLRSYAFEATRGPVRDDHAPERHGTQYGIADDGRLRSVCTHHEFTVSLRDEWVSMAGLADLTTAPTARRQGYVRELLEESLESWRGEHAVAALWPFSYEYYEQFGWARGCTFRSYTCAPDALAAAGDIGGTTRRVRPDEWHRLQQVATAQADEYEMVVRRTEDWWRERVFQSAGSQDRTVYAYERDGAVQGYLAYTSEPTDAGDRIRVLYSAAADRDAYRGLLDLLSRHESAEVVLYQPDDGTVFDLLSDPTAVECVVHPGMMVRIVDVVTALEAVAYPDDASGTLTLRVDDDTAPWNDRAFELHAADGGGECRPVDVETPDIHTDIGTLSQLVVGYHDVAQAQAAGALQTQSDDVTAQLSAWFPPRQVSPTDNF